MRTRKWFFVAVIALSMLAARGLYADFRAGYYTPAGPETIHQTLPSAVSTDATYDAGQFPIYYPRTRARGREGRCREQLRTLPQPALHHHATGDAGASVVGRSQQNEKDVRRVDPR